MGSSLAEELLRLRSGDVAVFCPADQIATSYVVACEDHDPHLTRLALYRGHDLDRPDSWRPVRITTGPGADVAARVAACMTLTWRAERRMGDTALPITA